VKTQVVKYYLLPVISGVLVNKNIASSLNHFNV